MTSLRRPDYKMSLCRMFVDLKKAFDSIKTEAMTACLEHRLSSTRNNIARDKICLRPILTKTMLMKNGLVPVGNGKTIKNGNGTDISECGPSCFEIGLKDVDSTKAG
uniref:Reverse transcriptase domain-containing protein n=1 Tax=Haemonchus contortus TaxID=6289 RepID=A0A7I4YN38_HAECO